MIRKQLFLTILFSCFLSFYSVKAQENTNNNPKIKQLIEKKRSYNKVTGFGFRVQLLNGNETAVKRLRSKFQIEYPTIPTYLRYDRPDWKVQVGNYKTKLEADKAINLFKEKFPSAIVIPL